MLKSALLTMLAPMMLLGISVTASAQSAAPTSRVPLIADDTSDPVVKEFYAQVRKRGGEPLNLHRTMANAPKFMEASSTMAYAIRYAAEVPRVYRELAIIRSVQRNGGHYEEMQHRPMALSCGITPAQLDAIAHWRSSTVFDEKQRAVLAWTDGVNDHKGPSDKAAAAMKKFFSNKEMVELTMIASNYAGTAMFTRALHTPLEPGAGDPNAAYGKC